MARGTLAGLLLTVSAAEVLAAPLSAASRAQLNVGQPMQVIVEFEVADVDRAANTERTRRRLGRDDPTIHAARVRGYSRARSTVAAAVRAPDAVPLREFSNLPMAVWRLSSLAALSRLQAQPLVRAIHEDAPLHVDSVSDLGFINQPQAAYEGATGAGTVIAVIDGGLGSNYLNYNDFGTCTAVNTPSTCRVLSNVDYYTNSAETAHGTNVSAIALGVAPGAKLAMYDVFSGTSALTSDIITAIDDIVGKAVSWNIVAVNLSLGDGSSHSSQCGSSNTRSTAYSPFSAPISALTDAGVMTVVAAGNSGSKSGLSDPACVPGAVSVGAVYDNAYGIVGWYATADGGGTCTDVSAADVVTCFSQSASYLSVLAPGSFVNAPNSNFQQSGTSQATPHVAGAVAVLRARYPNEPQSETLQRLQDTGNRDTDANAGNRVTSRLDLLGATDEATALTLSGTGPSQAVAGNTNTYTLTVSNGGPLQATTVQVTDTLPALATFVSASGGCNYAAGTVTCTAASLGAGSNLTFNIVVRWTASGTAYDTAQVRTDQNNSASSAQQQVAFGTVATDSGDAADAPLPLWAYGLMFAGLVALSAGNQRRHARSAI